ncbi:uncharacterized protein DEA37_0011645 [Paragonimus westermani]|uniref:Uncharacterized protein n=1 Tax=Paragonimus westermani TaxID=34504 RepID=A0A5J4NTP6_9TREM|nr:uncharacterized protein DEA37_0011645 [Paragonimus westermani]
MTQRALPSSKPRAQQTKKSNFLWVKTSEHPSNQRNLAGVQRSQVAAPIMQAMRLHCFLPNRSYITNALISMDNLTEAEDNSLISDAIFFDFAQTFYRVPYDPLKQKLEAYGIQGELLRWIAYFIVNRIFRVKTGSDLPSPFIISVGVPKGNAFLYADDLKIWNATDPSALRVDVDAINRWSDNWSLPLNDNECAHVIRASSTVGVKIELKKDLGIWLSSNMSLAYHHVMAAKKVLAALKMTRRTFSRMDKKTFQTLYGIYIRPLLEYANQVEYTGLNKDILAIERVQRATTKVVSGLRSVTYESRLASTDLYPLERRRLRGDFILTHFLEWVS